MQPSLDDSFLRLKRANQHIGTLRRIEGRLPKPKPLVINVESLPPMQDPNKIWHSQNIVTFDLGDPAGLVVGVISPVLVSEVIFHLRAALDYLIRSLSWLDLGSRPPELARTQFPVRSLKQGEVGPIPKGWKDDVKGFLQYLNAAHLAAIEALQPFHGGTWLELLAGLSNPDKHNELHVIQGQREIRTELTTKANGLPVSIDLEFAGQIAFKDSSPVIPTLDALKAQVSQTVNKFKPDFH